MSRFSYHQTGWIELAQCHHSFAESLREMVSCRALLLTSLLMIASWVDWLSLRPSFTTTAWIQLRTSKRLRSLQLQPSKVNLRFRSSNLNLQTQQFRSMRTNRPLSLHHTTSISNSCNRCSLRWDRVHSFTMILASTRASIAILQERESRPRSHLRYQRAIETWKGLFAVANRPQEMGHKMARRPMKLSFRRNWLFKSIVKTRRIRIIRACKMMTTWDASRPEVVLVRQPVPISLGPIRKQRWLWLSQDR